MAGIIKSVSPTVMLSLGDGHDRWCDAPPRCRWVDNWSAQGVIRAMRTSQPRGKVDPSTGNSSRSVEVDRNISAI